MFNKLFGRRNHTHTLDLRDRIEPIMTLTETSLDATKPNEDTENITLLIEKVSSLETENAVLRQQVQARQTRRCHCRRNSHPLGGGIRKQQG